jgi:hypothetical protein
MTRLRDWWRCSPLIELWALLLLSFVAWVVSTAFLFAGLGVLWAFLLPH